MQGNGRHRDRASLLAELFEGIAQLVAFRILEQLTHVRSGHIGKGRELDRTVQLLRNFESPVKRYTKLAFGGAQTDSNQRLMYTSA
jgi:hypothetical protein